MKTLHNYPSLHTAERLQSTIDQNEERLNYLKQQIEVTSLKIKNLKVIQADQSLKGEDERQAVSIVLQLAKTNDTESLKNILRNLL
jgi:hypothetical protein